MKIDGFRQHVQSLFNLLQVRFEYSHAFIGKEILPFWIHRCKDPLFTAEINHLADEFIGKHAFIVILQDHHVGIFGGHIIFKRVKEPVFVFRTDVGGNFRIEAHHVLVTADDTDLIGGDALFAMYQVC